MRREEDSHQRALVQWLEWRRLRFCHVPNGGARSKIEACILKGLGVRRGVPDILVFSRSPWLIGHGKFGVAIEMKSAIGRVSPEQREWIEGLSGCGWVTAVCRSSGEAIRFLQEHGY